MNPAGDTPQFSLFLAEPTRTGDGGWKITPGKPLREMTPKQVARAMGVHVNTIYDQIDAGLWQSVSRPAPRKILIDAEEVIAAKKASRDPERWATHRKKKRKTKK